MKINFLAHFYQPIKRNQQIMSYGTIILIVAVLMLFLTPNRLFFNLVWFGLAGFILFNFLAGLKVDQRTWTILSILSMSIFILYTLFFGQSLLFYGAALAITAFAALRYPKAGVFTVIVCTMWFERYFTLQSVVLENEILKLYPLDIVLIILSISVLYRVLNQGWRWQWRSKFDLPILLFGLVCTANFLYIMAQGQNDPFFAFGTYKNYFIYSIFYVLVLLIFKRRSDWRQLFHWLTVGGLGLFFFLGYGVIMGRGLWSEFTPLSTIGSRLIAGSHIFFMILFAFWLLALYFWKQKYYLWLTRQRIAIFLYLVSIATVVALVRHLWLALLLIGVFWLVYLLNKKQKKEIVSLLLKGVGITVGVALVFTLFYTFFVGNAPQYVSKAWYVVQERASVSIVSAGEDSSASYRFSVWQEGLRNWSFSPVFGLGLGKMLSGTIGDYLFEIASRELHNNYLAILVQLGLVGALAVAYWFITLLQNMYHLWNLKLEKWDFDKSLLFFAVNTVLLFMIVYGISVYWDVNFFVIWWWLALAILKYLWVVNRADEYEDITN